MLDAARVKQARLGYVEEVKKHDMYDIADGHACWGGTGVVPIGAMWVDINNSDSINPEYRYRRVAREINRDIREDRFAATPPLEALDMLITTAISQVKTEPASRQLTSDIIDVRRAYFHAKVCRILYVRLPAESSAGPGKCGKLKKAMSGTRDAAPNCEFEYILCMAGKGIIKLGQHSMCVLSSRQI